MNAPGRLMRLPEVLDETGLSRATVYRWIKAGTFPRQLRLGTAHSAWSRAEIEAWKAALPRA